MDEILNFEAVDELRELRQNFRQQLKPYLEMLISKRLQLTDIDWLGKVKTTQECILNNPEQYLIEPPKKSELDLIIHELFLEFLREHRKRRPF